MIKSYQDANGDIFVESRTKIATTLTRWNAAGKFIEESCKPKCLTCAEKKRIKDAS